MGWGSGGQQHHDRGGEAGGLGREQGGSSGAGPGGPFDGERLERERWEQERGDDLGRGRQGRRGERGYEHRGEEVDRQQLLFFGRQRREDEGGLWSAQGDGICQQRRRDGASSERSPEHSVRRDGSQGGARRRGAGVDGSEVHGREVGGYRLRGNQPAATAAATAEAAVAAVAATAAAAAEAEAQQQQLQPLASQQQQHPIMEHIRRVRQIIRQVATAANPLEALSIVIDEGINGRGPLSAAAAVALQAAFNRQEDPIGLADRLSIRLLCGMDIEDVMEVQGLEHRITATLLRSTGRPRIQVRMGAGPWVLNRKVLPLSFLVSRQLIQITNEHVRWRHASLLLPVRGCALVLGLSAISESVERSVVPRFA